MEGTQFKELDEFKKFAKEQLYDREDIDILKIDGLRRQLREKIIESGLLDLCRNCQIKNKEIFVSWAVNFIKDLENGEVNSQHV